MEGLCDMFSEQNPEADGQDFATANGYKLAPFKFETGHFGSVEIF
jgi:predicted nicotinamide N-methyase